MITDFKLVGLERLPNANYMSATCEPLDKDESFKALIDGDNDRKDALWGYCGGDWDAFKLAQVSHEGWDGNGMPVNPVVVSIEHY